MQGLKNFTYLIIFAIDQGQFEFKLCWINSKNSSFTLSVKAVHTASLNKYNNRLLVLSSSIHYK